MIFGVLIRLVLEFLRRRGLPVPDLKKLRRRQPRVNVTGRMVDQIVNQTDQYLERRRRDHGQPPRRDGQR